MTISYLKDPADFSRIQRVLVIKLQHLGDVLLTSPVFAALKQHYPHLEIDALVYADTAGMLKDNPNVNRIFCVDRAWKQQSGTKIAQEWSLFRTLKQRDYQLLLSFTDRSRAAWLSRLLKPAYSVAQKYPLKRGKFWRNSFTHLYDQPATPRHTVEMHLDALRRIGLYPDDSQKNLQMFASTEVEQRIDGLLGNHQLQAKQFILLHPTSRWMFKAWHADGFAEVVRILGEQGISIVLVSGPDPAEISYARGILERQNHCIDLCGQLTLAELYALSRRARCFIGLDSVAMHIAAAARTPCVALFGPSGDLYWHPWQVQHRVVASSHSCRPCGMDGCGNGKVSDCLQSIQPHSVADAALTLIRESQP